MCSAVSVSECGLIIYTRTQVVQERVCFDLRVFERGVTADHGETLACGTGACALAASVYRCVCVYIYKCVYIRVCTLAMSVNHK
jgi:diaminopimelate epimerase